MSRPRTHAVYEGLLQTEPTFSACVSARNLALFHQALPVFICLQEGVDVDQTLRNSLKIRMISSLPCNYVSSVGNISNEVDFGVTVDRAFAYLFDN